MNYQETLNLVNSFMDKAGVHDYCVKACGGHCCKDCYDYNELSCNKHEGDRGRLTCMMGLCKDLEAIFELAGVPICNPLTTEPNYSHIRTTILRTLRNVWRPKDVFHQPPPVEAIENFQIEERFVPGMHQVLSDKNAAKIKTAIHEGA